MIARLLQGILAFLRSLISSEEVDSVADVYIVEMKLVPSFPKTAYSTAEAAGLAQDAIDKAVPTSVQRSLSMAASGSYDEAGLAGAINAFATAQLGAYVTRSGVAAGSVIVADNSEWAPGGGGYHEIQLPVVGEYGSSAASDLDEWVMTAGAGANSFKFVVYGRIRWRKVPLT